MAITEKILIEIETALRGQEKIKVMHQEINRLGGVFKKVSEKVVSGAMKQQNALDVLAKKQRFYATWSNKLGVNTSRVNNIMSSQGMIFNKLGGITDHAGRSVQNLTSKMNAGKASTQKFQMEWLGVMFFGMAINRMFGQYVKGTLDMIGVNTLLTEGLKFMVLTALTPFLDNIINLASGLYDLPQSVQKAIGWFLILGTVLGGGLLILGQTALGIISLETAWNKHKGKFTALFTQKGFSNLMTKMNTIARVAAAGAALWLVYQGIKDKDDKPIKSLGEFLAAAGLARYVVKGKFGKLGGVGIAVGITLMLVGDEELMKDTIKTVLKIGKIVSEILIEAVKAGLSMRKFDISNVQGFANVGRAWNRALEEIYMEAPDLDPRFKGLSGSIDFLTESQENLKKEFDAGILTTEEYTAQNDALQDEINDLSKRFALSVDEHKKWVNQQEEGNAAASKSAGIHFSFIEGVSLKNTLALIKDLISWETQVDKTNTENYDNTTAYVNASNIELDKLNRTVTTTHEIITKRTSIWGTIGNILGFAKGGVVPGRLGTPVPAIVHGGERIVPANRSGGNTESNITLNVVYNVEVADKFALEGMFREHDIKLTEEVKRLIAV